MEYASSVGLTTAVDQGCCFWFGVNLPADQVHGYQTYYDLWEQGKLSLRLRFGGGGTPGPNGLPRAVAIRDAAMDSIGKEDDCSESSASANSPLEVSGRPAACPLSKPSVKSQNGV